MLNQHDLVLRAVRTTSYNNEIAAELLQELSSCNVSDEQARRIRSAARQLLLDADALECVWQELSNR
ncbi:hypothetical protein JVX91_17420 [Pseudomonas sp. PDNC002]|uniref:hypothetical protein n=1 Tax=Pseudomonas sp. PDNC002 TaxID=2811422 RepID=UPI001966C3A1|nr:hypothetical protein [Pseudomonas sp. PDNC002]QRY77386.1 hypothetical protein JVX91_17420 [Pseudomonas sp. PDNC002]